MELDAVRFTLKRVVSGRVVVLVRVHQRHTVRSTHTRNLTDTHTQRQHSLNILEYSKIHNTLRRQGLETALKTYGRIVLLKFIYEMLLINNFQ